MVLNKISLLQFKLHNQLQRTELLLVLQILFSGQVNLLVWGKSWILGRHQCTCVSVDSTIERLFSSSDLDSDTPYVKTT